MKLTLLAALLCALPVTADACSGPACCVVYGAPAVCRSAAVEREAVTIALVRCPACNMSDVAAAVYSLQMNRGPYESAGLLARDAVFIIRGGA